MGRPPMQFPPPGMPGPPPGFAPPGFPPGMPFGGPPPPGFAGPPPGYDIIINAYLDANLNVLQFPTPTVIFGYDHPFEFTQRDKSLYLGKANVDDQLFSLASLERIIRFH